MLRSALKLFILIFILSPYFSHAEIIISEIMYDLEGSDAGREWLEILNTGSSPIIINEYHFYEAGVHHGLNSESVIELAPNEYALIVQNIDDFITRYGSGKKLLRSSFSLNNTGEELAISDEDKNIIYSISYDAIFGGQGNGNSLSYGSNGWFESVPTPGESSGPQVPIINNNNNNNSSSSSSNNNNNNSSSSSNSSSNNNNNNIVRIRDKEIDYYEANIYIPSSGLAHSDVPIEGYVNHIKGLKTTKKLKGIYHLSFGDGNFLESDTRYDIYYQYKYPGTYTLALEYYKSSLSKELGKDPDAFITKDIIIHEPLIGINKIDSSNGITLKNKLNKRIDLYGWNISKNNQIFTFPKYSFIGARGEKTIPSGVHGLSSIYIQDWVILRNEHNVTISSFTKDTVKMNLAQEETPLPNMLPLEDTYTPSSLDTEDNVILLEANVLPLEDFNTRYLSQHPNKVLADFDEPKNISPEPSTDDGLPLYIIAFFGTLSLLLVSVRMYQKNNKQAIVDTDKVLGDIELI